MKCLLFDKFQEGEPSNKRKLEDYDDPYATDDNCNLGSDEEVSRNKCTCVYICCSMINVHCLLIWFNN